MKNLVALRNPIGIVYDIIDCKQSAHSMNSYILTLLPKNNRLGTTQYQPVTKNENGVHFREGWEGIYE